MTNSLGASDSVDHAPGPRAAGPLVDILIVAAVSGLAYFLEDLAIARGWMPFATEIRGVSSVLAGAIAAVGVVLARGGSLADLGLRQPKRWTIVPLQVTAILAAFIAAQTIVPSLVSFFIALPEPNLSRYDAVAGNLGAAIVMAIVLPFTASIPEEVIYRGFLIGRLSDWFGRSAAGASTSVLVQAVVFGAIHFQWGIGGMLMTFMMGVIWGAAYLLCGRNLWIVIMAHSAGHILLVVQLYLATAVVV